MRIARLTVRFWQDPAAPPEVVERLQHIYGMIAPALAVMDPPLAETLFVRVPLTWATSDDAIRRKQGLAVLILSWELFFGYEQQEILLQALPRSSPRPPPGPRRLLKPSCPSWPIG